MWGDEWFKNHGEDLVRAMAEVQIGLRKLKVSAICKEKYGTLRIDNFHLWDGMIHGLLYPGYVYGQYRWSWMWKLDVRYIRGFNQAIGLTRLVQYFQNKAVKRLMKRVGEKYPHIREEIMFEFEGWENVR
jgi:hypothetical protein